MITNNEITLFHKKINSQTHSAEYETYNIEKVWVFNEQKGIQNSGYEQSKGIEIRVPYKINKNLKMEWFNIGDIITIGKIKKTIQSDSELNEKYVITYISNNLVGNEPHIHLRGI